MRETYGNCINLNSNVYFYSPNINGVVKCFYNWPTNKYLNIYLPTNSTSLTTCLTNNSSSLIGQEITWTNDTENSRYYNTQYNFYIYPVENVAAAREANGD